LWRVSLAPTSSNMGVKVTKLWLMHLFALVVYFFAPPIYQHFVNTRSMQPGLPGEPEESLDSSTEADVVNLLQVGVKVLPGMVSQPKVEHANVQVLDPGLPSGRSVPDQGEEPVNSSLPSHLRPHLGRSREVVGFAIYVKNFFGMKISNNQFTVEVVLTVRWTDHRVSKLVPKGTQDVTMSLADAEHSMWMPDIVVVNRAINGQERVSSAIKIHKTGKVEKTERLLVRVKQHFDVTAFPFDYQRPKIVVSSSTLMSEDLVLQVLSDDSFQGAKPGLFDDREFQFLSDETSVFAEVDGSLNKSRGKLVMTLRRDWTRYLQTTILPEIFLILISFTVFWMPRATPFAMPRVATNLISFLTLMTLSINTASMLPSDRAGMAWIELFADSMQMQNSLILFLNVFVDWVYQTLDLKELGEKLSNQLAFLFPVMGFVVVIICFTARSGEHLDRVQNIVRIWMFGVQGTWIMYSLKHVREAELEQAEKAEAK